MATRPFPRAGAGRIVRKLVFGEVEEGQWRILVCRSTVGVLRESGGWLRPNKGWLLII